MSTTPEDLTCHLLERVDQVRCRLGLEEADLTSGTQLGDLLDSMAMVEFLARLADDCGVKPSAIEECVGRRFGTLAELAQALAHAGIAPVQHQPEVCPPSEDQRGERSGGWLEGIALRLPVTIQPAEALDVALQRPVGWFESHAGIRSRRVWHTEDPLEAATAAARQCLDQAGLTARDVGALLVTSEAPPLLTGLGATLHHRLELLPRTVALEIGGACTGFLAALWTGQQILPAVHSVLVISVEAPSYHLSVEPGPAGETAALFGDGAAACVLADQSLTRRSTPLRLVDVAADGGSASLLRVEKAGKGVEVRMEGSALASRAVTTMTEGVRVVLRQRGLRLEDLVAVVMHGGNGRMPGLLARQLGLRLESVWSTTPETGNLGSASLPAAWAERAPASGPAVWVGVGAGLTWGAALLG